MPERFYNIEEAATFLGMTIRALRDHLYFQRDLIPDDKRMGLVYFKRSTLQRFRRNKRRPGNPSFQPKGQTHEYQPPRGETVKEPGGEY